MPSDPNDVLGLLTDPVVQPDPDAYGYKGHPGGGGIQELRYFTARAMTYGPSREVVVQITDHKRDGVAKISLTPAEAHRLAHALLDAVGVCNSDRG